MSRSTFVFKEENTWYGREVNHIIILHICQKNERFLSFFWHIDPNYMVVKQPNNTQHTVSINEDVKSLVHRSKYIFGHGTILKIFCGILGENPPQVLGDHKVTTSRRTFANHRSSMHMVGAAFFDMYDVRARIQAAQKHITNTRKKFDSIKINFIFLQLHLRAFVFFVCAHSCWLTAFWFGCLSTMYSLSEWSCGCEIHEEDQLET